MLLALPWQGPHGRQRHAQVHDPFRRSSPLCPVRSGRRSLALHASATAWISCRVLSCQRCLHALSWRFQRVLQPTPSLGALHYGQYHGLARRLQAHHQDQRQYLAPLHFLPGDILPLLLVTCIATIICFFPFRPCWSVVLFWALEPFSSCWWVPLWLLSASTTGLVSSTTWCPSSSSCWSAS